jgi:hypothetical protein
MSAGLAHFTIKLDLQTSYLFSFEREGCVTKQLYFDTHVPDVFLDKAPFDFPFQVTLEPPPHGQHFQYAGPVGNIRFFEDRGDFAYDTDYSKLIDPAMEQRMEEVRRTAVDTVRTVVSSPVSRVSGPVPVIEGPSSAPVEVLDSAALTGTLVPAVETAPPLVHLIGDPATTTPATSPDVRHHHPPPKVSEDPPVVVPPVRTSATGDKYEEQVLPAGRPPDSRDEELIVERLRVTTIVRIVQDGDSSEYRRVAHAYGAVFYFKDGVSCDQWTYDQGIADPEK